MTSDQAPDPIDVADVLQQAGEQIPSGGVTVEPLPGGASRETWVVGAGSARYVLKRDPLDDIEPWSSREREFRVAQAADRAGVPVPRALAFEPRGGRFQTATLSSKWVEGTSSPRRILSSTKNARRLLFEIGAAAGRVASIEPEGSLGPVPPEPVADSETRRFASEVMRFAPDRPVFALALRWLEVNPPPPRRPVVLHGDLRLGNLMVDAEGGLTALIDWEFARHGEASIDLGFFCIRPWRFGNDHLRAGGLGEPEVLLDGYASTASQVIDLEHLRWGEVAAQLWWGLYCLRHSQAYARGEHRSLERLVLGRRVPEVEWDLLDLLEGAP